MVIVDNRKTVIYHRLGWFLATLGLIVLLTLVFYAKGFADLFGIDKSILSTVFTGIYLGVAALYFIIDYQYVRIEVNEQRMRVRYSSLRPFVAHNKAFEISRRQKINFRISKSFLGLKSSLIIELETAKGKALYPPVCISALSRSENKKLSRFIAGYGA